MDHAQAIEGRTTERYLLGELPAQEAEEFERHYFECANCAEAVELGIQFVDNARAVLAENRPAAETTMASSAPGLWKRIRSWWSFPVLIPAAAAVALAVVAAVQAFVTIPGLRQTFENAHALPAFQLAGAARGAGIEIRVPAGTPSVALAIDVPPDAHFAQFLCVLRTGTRTVFQVPAPAPPSGQPITVLAPARNLSPGDYEFTVFGLSADGNPNKVTSSTFQFNFQ